MFWVVERKMLWVVEGEMRYRRRAGRNLMCTMLTDRFGFGITALFFVCACAPVVENSCLTKQIYAIQGVLVRC